MTDELTQLRQRLALAEADAAAMRAGLMRIWKGEDNSYKLANAALLDTNAGAAILAVAEAARAYVQANDYDNLADLLVALKGAVDRWER